MAMMKKAVAKKGMHKMPDGTMMKNSDMKKPTPKPKSTKKPKPLTGPAAVEAIQRRTSFAGVKKAEKDAKKATKKKYPGLYNK